MALQTPPSEPAERLQPGSESTGYHRAVGRRRLRVLLAGCVGALLGIGAYTFRYAEGLSYFSTEPSACANCHIMQSQYQSWGRASHHSVAVCVDCHLPHAGLRKLLAKAENGYRHSKEFTAQTFAEPIFVQATGQAILEENCRRCHAELTAALDSGAHLAKDRVRCVHCHSMVGHGEPARLGGPLPYVRTTRNVP